MTTISTFTRTDGRALHTCTNIEPVLPIGVQVKLPGLVAGPGSTDPGNRYRIVSVLFNPARDTVDYTVERVAP